MKSFSMNTNGAEMTWRSRLAVAVGLALTVAAAACSGAAGTATSPSGVAPSSAGTNAGPSNDRKFDVTILETTIPVGASELTVTITNLNVNSSQKLGSVQIYLPAGLTPTSVDGFSANPTWSGGVSGQTVEVGGPGSAKLDNGQSVTFKLHVTSTTCGVYNFVPASAGSNESLENAFSSTWDAPPTALSVTVEGCTACDDPNAPAISHAYFTGELGLAASDPRHDLVQKSVAHEQAADKTFHGISPCDHPAFENAVKAYVDGLLSGAIPYYNS